MDVVWIYSVLNDTLVKNESPSLFQNLFPNKHNVNSIIGAHYSPKTKKFYFFSGFNQMLILFKFLFLFFICFKLFLFKDKYYFEYENQDRCIKRNSTKNLTSKLVSVIQNHEDYDSVYLVDANGFVYYLNLKNDYLESVDRTTATYKLFSGCFHSLV